MYIYTYTLNICVYICVYPYVHIYIYVHMHMMVSSHISFVTYLLISLFFIVAFVFSYDLYIDELIHCLLHMLQIYVYTF